MTSYRGTGDALVEIELPFCTLVVRDDGYNDPDVNVRAECPDGEHTLAYAISKFRRGEYGDVDGDRDDEEVIDQLEAAFNGDASGSGSGSYTDPLADLGPFVCDGCNLTWPGSRRHREGGDELCPECADD